MDESWEGTGFSTASADPHAPVLQQWRHPLPVTVQVQVSVTTSIEYMLFNAEYCGVTQKGALQIADIKQLEELALGKPEDYSDEPAAKTETAYRTILGYMRNLKELEMLGPDLQELNLRTS